ncbi:MAG: type I 3-dehydroquinate dehydratase [Clostridia bacterium]|nr:type I 3-dehydroquinate dehydratase [Clostridia bacterium]
MSATQQIRGLSLGNGHPKIIVPIAAATEKDILACAHNIAAHPSVDLAEWRADHWEHGLDGQKSLSLLASLRHILQDKPLLYTFRTVREGGMKAISDAAYVRLCESAAASRHADLIDVEVFSPCAGECIRSVHAHGVSVVGSWHDFEQTPPEETLVSRFRHAQAMGADVLKIAVMANSKEDAHTLLRAAQGFYTREAQRPMIAIAMGKEGMESRIDPRRYASCMSFGTLGAPSAPGQINVDTLHDRLYAKR